LLAKINNIWELRLKGRDLKIDYIKIMLNYLKRASPTNKLGKIQQ
jgi:hypothetical protein